jgi:hypothetical protein
MLSECLQHCISTKRDDFVNFRRAGCDSRGDVRLRLRTTFAGQKVLSRSRNAVIRVYDEGGNVIETHEHAGEFKEW